MSSTPLSLGIPVVIGDVVADAGDGMEAFNGIDAAIKKFGAIPAGTKKLSDVLELNVAISKALEKLADDIQVQTGLKL